MRPVTKYFLFILDDLIILLLVMAILYRFNASLESMIIALVVLGIVLTFASYVFLPQLRQPVTGSEGLIGMKGVALESFDDQGEVLVHGERWHAIISNTTVEKGDTIIVSEVHGLTLTVKKRADE